MPAIEQIGRIRKSYPTAGIIPPPPYHTRDVGMVGNRITPALLTELLLERNAGYRQRWVDFADEQLRNNLHLFSQKSLAEQAVVETDFRIVPADDSDAAKKTADACKALLKTWARAGLKDWIAEIVGAEYYGAGSHEVIWQRDGTEIVPVWLKRIQERRLSYACDPLDSQPDTLRLWDPFSLHQPIYGTKLEDFGDDKVLIHEPRVLGGLRLLEGLFSAIVWYSVFTVWCWRDLMALNEMIGRPPAVAYYAAGGARMGRENEFSGTRNATPQEVKAGKAAVFGMSSSMRAVLPDTIRLELLKMNLPAGEPVQLLTEARANALISKAWHGIDTISDLKPGSRAAQQVQEETGNTLWRARCWRAAQQLNTVLEWYIRANPAVFGVDPQIPSLEPDIEPLVDRLVTAQGLSEAQRAGLKIPKAWAYKILQVPEPGPDDEVLEDLAQPTIAPVPALPPA